MSPDPHSPTPAGPDPDEETKVHKLPEDPFAPEETVGSDAAADTAERAADGAPEPVVVPLDAGAGADVAGAVSPTPTPAVSPADATPGSPAGSAAPVDWLKPDAASPEPDPLVKTPDAFTPPGTPTDGEASTVDAAKAKAEDTVDAAKAKADEAKAKAQDAAAAAKVKADEAKASVQDAQEKATAGAKDAQAKALEFYEKPEGKVALAFVGGVVASFVLKRLGS